MTPRLQRHPMQHRQRQQPIQCRQPRLMPHGQAPLPLPLRLRLLPLLSLPPRPPLRKHARRMP